MISLTRGSGNTGQKPVKKKMKLDYFLTPYTKINSKWIKDLNVRTETINSYRKTLGRTLSNINQNNLLYDPPPTIMEIKINKWDLPN